MFFDKRTSHTFWISAALSSLIACAPLKTTPASSANKEHSRLAPITPPTQKDSMLFKEIQELYSKKSFALAQSKIREFEKNFHGSPHFAHIKNIEGLIFFLTNQPKLAIQKFQEAIKKKPSDLLFPYLLYNLASAQYEATLFREADLTLHQIRLDLLNNETREKLEALQARLNQKKELMTIEPDPNVVGVLLPLKGKFEPFGARSLQGIELAFKVFNFDEPESSITLAIEDSGETPEQAVAALEKLYFQHKAIAILGPLLSKGIDQVTQKAQELGVPLIHLAQNPGVLGDAIFPASITPKLQADAIAQFAIKHLGMKKFAILHPRDRFGDQVSQHFWDTIESLGGEITGVESYLPDETDFKQAIDKLAGLYYSEARQRELDALAEERKANQIKKRTRKTEQYFSLKPIVHFEAVFIPDEARAVSQILPTFAYRDIEKIQFLGISTWNTRDLITRAKNHAEGALFVDIFHAENDSLIVKKFIEKYQTTFGYTPGSAEATAYDAASLLEELLRRYAPKSRASLKEKLKNTENFPGVTGLITYKNGLLIRDLFILSVKNGKITQYN